MAQQFKVIINAGKEDAAQTLQAEQGAGQRGRPLIIKAKAGAKYQLVETGKAKGNTTDLAPDNIKAKRVGKHLHLMFETDTVADVIIEDYYDVMAEGYNGVIGKAENGSFYEYLTEDPTDPGLIPQLKDNVTAVTQALGGAEVSPAGAAVAFAAFPLLGALGLLGGAAAVAAAANTGTTTTTTGTTTGKLDITAPNDSGVLGDNLTNDNTPTLTGTVPTGSTATVTINGQTYPVTVNPNGTWSFTNPTNLPDGTYYPVLNVTTNGVTTPTNLTPFTIDTTPPTVAVVSNAAALAAGETANITFTLSEPSSDFALDDIAVSGGTLSGLTQSATDPKVYTATFTPSSTGTSATISVASDKFADAAANRNTDGAEANNTVSFKTNATVTGALTPTAPNDSGTLGDNLTNDNTPALSGKVPVGSTATVTLNGKTYPATVDSTGKWTAQIPDTDKLPDGTYTPQLNVTTGGVTTTTPITPFTIDTVPPTVAVTSASNILVSGQTTNVTFTLSEAVTDFTASDITVTGGTLGPLTQSATDPKIWTAVFTPATGSTQATIAVNNDKFSDAAANFNKDTAISPAPADRTYEANNQVTLTTNALASGQLSPASDNTTGVPNDHKTNDTTPELTGKVPAGATATVTVNGVTYPVTVAPDGTWTFTQPNNLPDGTYTPVLNVTQNGQTSSVPITPFTIDTVPPTVVVSGSNTAALSAGQSTTLTFTVSEATTNLTDADLVVVGGTLGPLQQSASNPLVYTATFTATPGTTANTTASVSIASDKFADAAGNLNKDGAETNNTWSSTVTPASNTTTSVKTALTIDAITGDNVVTLSESGATSYTVTGKVTGTFVAGDVVTLKLNDHSYNAVVNADGTYTAVVPMSDIKADSDTKIEGSVTGTGGQYATAAQDYTVEATNAVTQTALSINPVTADNIIGSTESTGSIAITGTVTGKFAAGDIVTLTVKGVNYSGTAAANGTYSINVPATELIADSDTQVDGTVTGTGGTVAKAVQDYGVDANINPASASLKTALTIDSITGDNVITLSESGASTYTVTGKVTGTFAVNDVVTLTLNTHPYLATVKADGTYSVIVPMSDLKADSDTKIEGTVTGTGGDTATAAQDYVVETTNVPTQTALTIDPVTADNIIGSTESTGNITLTGHVTGKYAAGDIVKLTVAGVTYSGTAAADGSYSIPVPATGLIADSDTTVDGTVTGTGGTVANALQNYGVDANINPAPTPTATGALTPTAPNDSGTLGDNLTNDNTPALSGTVPVGSTATVTINGQTYPVIVNPDGTWTAQVPDTAKLPDGTYYPVLNVTTNGVPSKTNLTPFTIDTVPPTVVVTSSAAALASGQTATITFTLSEVAKDFVDGDIVTTGGTLSTLVQSTTDPKVYTATFTPTPGSAANSTATISIVSDKFSDAAANLNKDTATSPAPAGATYEANNQVSFKTNASVTGALTPTAPNDSGTLGDNKTNDTTPTLNGTVPPGSTATVTINGQTYPVTVDPQGNWTFTNPTNLPDGTYTPQLNVTTNGQTTTTPITPFTIDTVPPTVIVTSASNILVSGQTTNVTFTLSEAVTDFANGDIAVTGGTLGPLTQSATDPKVWTAVFTPATGGAQATISVASDKFSDAAANFNKDTATSPAPAGSTYEANNQVTLTTNATASGSLSPNSDNSTGTPNDNKTNDKTPELSGKVPAGSTATVTINGQTYPVTVNPDGTWNFTQPVDLPDGNYTPQLNVTTNSQTTTTPITPFTIDTLAPSVIVSGSNTSPLAAGQSTTLTFTVSEATTNLTDADLVVAGGTLGPLQQSATNPLVYTATFTATPGATGNIAASVSIASDKFTDAAGNLNKDTYVSPAPAGATTETNNSWTSNYTAPSPTGDTTPPTIVVSRTNAGSTLDANGKETLVFTLSEASTTFDANDIVIANGSGTITGFAAVPTSGTAATGYTQYTAIFTPTAGTTGTATIGVASGKFADNAGNLNQDTYLNPASAGSTYEVNNFATVAYDTQSTNPVDNDKPTVQISIDKTTLSAGQTATLSIILSEASTNFAVGDLTVISGGGTVTNLQAVPGSNGTQYTATYTAGNSAGPVYIGVAETTFSDAAGNQNADTYKGSAPGTGTPLAGTTAETNNWVQLTNTGTTDTTPPTVAVTRTGSGTVGATGESIVFTFSEGVPTSSFTLADIDATGGAMSNLVPVESSKTATGVYTQYTATFTPASGTSGTASIGVAANKFTDVTGNNNLDTYSATADSVTGHVIETNNQVVLSYNASTNPAPVDTTPPTIAITADKTTLTAGQTSLITFTLSEASNNFTQSDVTTTGGGLSNWTQVNPTTYTATFTATTGTQSTGSVHVASNSFTDAAPNYNQDGAEANNTLNFITNSGNVSPTGDTTPPTIVVSRTNAGSTLDANGKETLVFTLSEASTSFDDKDIVIVNGSGTITGFAAVPTSGTAATGYTQYTAIFTPTAGSVGTATIGVASGKFADNAGNLNQDTYLSPAPAGSTYQDNNFVTVAYDTQNTNPVDNDKPTVQISIDKTTLSAGQTATLSFILSEASSNFALGDITVIQGGGTVTNLQAVPGTNGTQYTATYTAGSSASTVLIGVAESTFSDAAGNQNADTYKGSAAGTSAVSGGIAETNNWVALTNTGSLDTTPPTVAVTRTGTGTVGATGESIVFTFSEGVATGSFTLSDIDATGGAMSALVPVESSKTATGVYTQYTATYTPTSGTSGTASIGVAASKFTDVSGNNNADTYVTGTGYEANNQVVLDYNANTNPTPVDNIPPTIAITADKTTLTAGQTALITFTLSEASSNFVQGDVTTTGGGLSNWTQVNPTTYTAIFTATTGSQGTGSVHVDNNAFSDAAPNYNQDGSEANNTVNFITNSGSDLTPPTIAITSNQTSLSTGQTATITFTLSEASTDFTAADINYSGGTLGTLTTTDNITYTATFTPATNSVAPGVISVAAGKFHDAANNQNLDTYSATADNIAGHLVETNNIVNLTVNTTTTAAALNLTSDKATVIESGFDTSNVAVGTNPVLSVSATSGVLSNDTGTTPTVTGIQKFSDANATAVSASTTSSTGTSIAGQYGTLKIGADGSYVYTVDNTNATVQALRTTANTVNEVFTYTANDGTGPKTATLVVTVQGANDAPTVVVQEADKTLTAGTALTPFSILGNFADVDSTANGETATYTATLTNGGALPSWLTFNAATGTFSGTPPTAGVTSIDVTRKDQNNLTVTDTFLITVNAAVDSTPPKIAITSDQSRLLTGQTATITFTISEATSDFSWDGTTGDITVTGGTLGALTHVGVNAAGEDIYTANFVPTANSTTAATIAVAAGKFQDASSNQNLDTYSASADNITGHLIETNNIVTLTVDTTTAAASLNLTSDKATAVEAGGAYSATGGATAGTNPAVSAASGVLANDTGTTPTVTGIQKISDTSATAVSASTTGGTGTSIVGQYGTLKMGADGSYVYTVDNNNATVQALRTTANTVTDVFTYTATDASGSKTANLVVTVQGANDAPTVTLQEADKTLTLGSALTPFSILGNFADVDSTANGETAVYSTSTLPAGVTFNATTGTFSGTPTSTGTTSVTVTRTDALGLSVSDTFDIIVNAAVDSTPPKIAITSNQASLTTGQTATITFTISEATTDFADADITVTGGNLGTLTHVGVNAAGEDIYTAVFTPTANSTTAATIAVAAGKFHDAATNQNLDTYSTASTHVTGETAEANNIVTLSVNTTVVTALSAVNDTATAVEAGGTTNGTAGTNPTFTAATGVLANDTGATPLTVTGVQLLSASGPSAVTAATTSATGTVITGQYGSLTMGADGSYVYTVANSNAAVQALRTSANTLTEVFTYTATDSSGSKTANLVVTVQGANDEPTVVVQEADKAALVGTAITPFSIANNFADVDSSANGETATYTATVGGAALPSWLSFNASTGTFTGTPTAAGTTSVTVTRTDAGGLFVTDTFDIVATLPVINTTVSFSSMTKDSGVTADPINHNWITNDPSAGRLISGDISAPLATGEVVKVYANGTLIGNAVVNGTKWEITDLGGYNANWTYTAQVVGAANNTGPISADRLVTLDATEVAPAISAVYDTASTPVLVGNDPAVTATHPTSTSNAIGSVSGTGVAGNTIYLYDNNYTTLVGTAVVDGSGNWSVTSLTGTFAGSNTFAAKQVDAQGNHSVLSNQWTVSTPLTNLLTNGDFSSGASGFTFYGTQQATAVSYDATDNYIVGDLQGMTGARANTLLNADDIVSPRYTGAPDALTPLAEQTSGALTWQFDQFSMVDGGVGSSSRQRVGRTFESLAGTVGDSNNVLTGNVVTSGNHVILSTTVNVVAGKTYTFSYDYLISFWQGTDWGGQARDGRFAAVVDGVKMEVPYTLTPDNDNEITTGTMTATYTATTTKAVTIQFTGTGNGNQQYGDYALDNIFFAENSPASQVNTFSTAGPTANPDTALTYTAGALDSLDGNDTITATSTSLQATLAAGGLISGGAGVDTLKLAAGTTLNLSTLTHNQTVRSIEQIEVFEMTGTNSVLSMTANDVLSLGGTNTGTTIATSSAASTMAPYSFGETNQTADAAGTPTGTTSSANKVQMVVNGVTGDTLNLAALATDGVTTAGAEGNTGLAGTWAYKGKVSINNIVYKVYDHSTTQAQVLVDVDVNVDRELPVDPALALVNDTAIAIEAGGTTNATSGTNSTGNVLSNDQGATPHVTGIQLVSASSATAVASGTTSSTGTQLVGQYGTLTMGADGSYTYAVDNANATVQGLRTASNTLSEVFTYTANDGTGAKTANLVVTIKGANDAPTVVVQEADKTGTVGTAINSFSIVNNFADVDSTANGETATYSVSALPAGLTFNAATGTFSGTPTTAGTTSVTVTRTDAGGLSVTDTFDIVITDVITKTVAFSTMTKDSGTLEGNNANWLTADTSAGRLVSGTVSAALGANEVVEVYANGTKIGNARVVGQAWDITDLNGYNANWTYTAKVVNPTTSSSGAIATQLVSTDLTEAAPVITGVFDVATPGAATVANNGSTFLPIESVSGTASANALIYLYDNTSTNLVGTAVADASGNWTVSGFGVLPSANTFSAKQVDVHGNESGLSNLWTVNTTASAGINGNFDSGATTGFATDMTFLTGATSFNYVRQRYGFAVLDKPVAYDTNNNPQTVLATLTQSATNTWNGGADTWSEKIYAPGSSVAFEETEKGYNTFLSLASGKVFYGSMDAYGGVGQLGTIWGSSVDVVKGQTYQFKFDYWNTIFGLNTESPTGDNRTFIHALINGTEAMVTRNSSTGSVTINYTATSTGSIDLKLGAQGWSTSGDFALDNISFAAVTPANGSLVPGSNPSFNDSANGTSATPVSYSGGAVNAMGGNDVLAVAASVNLQTALATGGSYINGGAGVDTLVLNAGTTLNLPALTQNQTVQPIQQVEIIKLQGTSTLTLSANDVLSLGGANATTMSGYNVAGSTGKVQMVIDATNTDNLVLTPLTTDGVTTNGVLGNTGLAGVWTLAGTSSIGSTSYQVYNHSTTDAQVLVAGGANVNPNGTVNSAQSVVITKVENTGAATVYAEEFNGGTSTVAANLLNPASPPTYTTSTAINTAASKITTGAWEISTVDIWNSWQANQSYTPVNELYLRSGATAPASTMATAADTLLGTDGKLQLGLNTNESPTGSGDGRLYTFTSKAGPFSAISLKSFGLDNRVNGTSPTQWNYPQVEFYDDQGNVVYRADFKTLSLTTQLDNLNVTLPAGVTASSFGFRTLNADRWFIDELSMTAATNEIVPHLGTTVDTTHKISGTYATALQPGETIKIYDATGTTYLGDAVVDPATKTWTFESATPALVGTHPYVAKIESASAVVATSNTYTVNILGAGQLDIAAISADSGTAGDFITSDNTIVYNGTLPQPLATGEKVLVQIYAANGTTLLRSSAVTPASGSTTWTWDDSASAALADGDYVIKATIVATDGVTAVSSYGTRGVDVQPMTIDAAPPAQTVTITSMTKDSGIATGTADWTTADGSAGRLVSGSLSAALGTNEVVKVYANGAEIGNATVSGTQWTLTDTSAYNANWTYTAKVVDTAGGAGPVASRAITLDTTEAAATITSVMETAGTAAITDGSGTVASAKTITSISGAGVAGDIVYVYDNSSTNLVGSATVAAGGTWTVTPTTPLTAGAHTFMAVQRDALGNISPNSNMFKIAAGAVNTSGNMLSQVTLEEEGAYNWSQSSLTNTNLNFYPGLPINTAPGNETFRVFFKQGGMSSVSITFSVLPDLQYSAAGVRIGFYDANGDLLGMMRNGVNTSYMYINGSASTYTYNSGTFLNGQLAARMEVSLGVATAYSISNLGLTPGDTNTLTSTTPLGVVGTGGNDAMTYNGGAMSGLGGDDVITAQVSTVQTQLAAGGIINGGAGTDTLKLQAGTVLDLTALTGNQTVKNIQEVEIFQMQGKSTLTLSANDVLSLGATELSGYSFVGSNTASAGKVQLVVQGTATDKLNLSNLAGDALGSNTGTLPGEWVDKGTATIGGATYHVYDHSTSKAQVLVGGATQTAVTSNAVTISSMTLDTGTAGDFITSNGAAGRTVTGTIATALTGSDHVEVYANGVLIGNAAVSGTTWTITDTGSHADNWTYTAKLVAATGNSSATTNVVYDAVEAAPVITRVTDSSGSAVASGTLSSGDMLPENTYADAATVPADFAWNLDHVGPNGLTSDSPLTTGPKTVNPMFGIKFASQQDGEMFDAQNPTGLGSKIEMASKNLLTLTKGQTYTFSFDGQAEAKEVNLNNSALAIATQIKWVLLDANGVFVTDLTPWYSGPGNVEKSGGNYGEAIRLSTRPNFSVGWETGWTTYQSSFTNNFDSGQYRLAVAYEGGNNAVVLVDRVYFGVAKNPVNSVSGTGTAGSLIQLFDNGTTTVIGSTTVAADGTWTVGGMNLAAGTHSFTAKSTDAAGTLSAASVAYNATVTPVALDLNGDGQVGYSQIKMDLNNDGILDTTSWVAAQDGLLVHDVYGDGSVRENSQFAFARHGGETDLQGLAAQFDSNVDGVLDAKDAQFGEIAVWQDADQDGVADAGEVKHLAEMGISSIKLTSDGVARTPATGVTETGHTSAQLANGATMVVADAAFDYTLGKADTVQADAAKSTELVGPVALPSQDAAVTEQPQAAAPVVQTAAAPVAEATAPAADATAPAPAADATVEQQVVDVTINEVAPTGTEPMVLQPASALIQNKPYTLSPEQIAQFQAVVDAATAAAGDNVVDVTINELAPTGLEPLVFQHVLPTMVDANGAALVPPTHCEPSVMVPPAPVDAAVPTDATAVVDQQQPTHCDEPWLIELNGPAGTEPVVFNLNPAAWNKPFALSAEQLSELGLPVPTDSNVASPFKLNVTDVLLTPADGVTPPALQINGAPVNANTLNLSNLLGAEAAPTQLTATGTVQHDGQSFTYQVDATLQAMIDQQHLQHATMS